MSEAQSANQFNPSIHGNAIEPSAAEAKPPMAEEGLGSLAQSARTSHLKSARTTLFVIGVLTIIANLGMAALAQNLVDQELRNEPEQVKQQVVLVTQFVAGGFAAVGVIFLILGSLIYKAPVPCTVLALILYIAGQAISVLLDPTMLAKGAVVKVIIIVALVKAVQAALAYRREEMAAAS